MEEEKEWRMSKGQRRRGDSGRRRNGEGGITEEEEWKRRCGGEK